MERRRLISIKEEQYEELTSIWSTNGGYFLTGILPSIGHDKLEVKFQNRTAQSSYGKMICCAMEVYSSFMCVLDSGTYRKWSVRAGNNYTNNGPSVNYNVHIAVVDTVNDIYKEACYIYNGSSGSIMALSSGHTIVELADDETSGYWMKVNVPECNSRAVFAIDGSNSSANSYDMYLYTLANDYDGALYSAVGSFHNIILRNNKSTDVTFTVVIRLALTGGLPNRPWWMPCNRSKSARSVTILTLPYNGIPLKVQVSRSMGLSVSEAQTVLSGSAA